MKTKRAGVRDVLRQVRNRPDRSSLFHWMVEHHDEVVAEADGGKLIWAKLCATFASLGLTNQHGNLITEVTARKTWERVRKAVANKRVQALRRAANGPAPRGLMPSASMRNRTPIEASRPASSTAPPSGSPSTSSGSGIEPRKGGQLLSDEEARAKVARLVRTLEERSGR